MSVVRLSTLMTPTSFPLGHDDLASAWVKMLIEILRLPDLVPLALCLDHIRLHGGAVEAIQKVRIVRCSLSQSDVHDGLSREARPRWA